MSTDPIAYVSTHPDVLAAIRQQKADEEAWRSRLLAIIGGLYWVDSARLSVRFGKAEVVSLELKAGMSVPPGWKYSERMKGAVPIKGKRGEVAAAVLASFGEAVTPGWAVATVGAPQSVTYPDGRQTVVDGVAVFPIGDSVHLLYDVEPTEANTTWSSYSGAPDARWTREPLSAFYAAKEAAERVEVTE